MTTFQNQVNILAGEGIQGTISRVEPVTGLPAIAGDANVVAGKFVFSAGDGVTYTGFGTGANAGIAIQNGSADDRTTGVSLAIAQGTSFFRLTRGFAWIKSTTAAVAGDKVGVVSATGVIDTGANPSGTDTGWVVVKGGAIGSNIEIAPAGLA